MYTKVSQCGKLSTADSTELQRAVYGEIFPSPEFGTKFQTKSPYFGNIRISLNSVE